MEQLVMRWSIERTPEEPKAPDWGEFVCRTFNGSDEDVDKWLDIVRYGLSDVKMPPESFWKIINDHGAMEPDKLFIVECGGDAAATLTVIPNYETKEGYIHMVACKPEYRGRGVGTRLNAEAVRTLHRIGMRTAYLTTDDFRIPAIKSYLRAGFYPDIVDEDHRARWDAVTEIINSGKKI